MQDPCRQNYHGKREVGRATVSFIDCQFQFETRRLIYDENVKYIQGRRGNQLHPKKLSRRDQEWRRVGRGGIAKYE